MYISEKLLLRECLLQNYSKSVESYQGITN